MLTEKDISVRLNPVAANKKVNLGKNPRGVFCKGSTHRPPDWLKVLSSVSVVHWFETIAYIVLKNGVSYVHGLLIPLQSSFVDGLH